LKKLSNSGIISSSIYLYFSSPIAVLNEYLDKRKEVAVFGENTFYPIYNNLNRIGAKVNLKPYPKGYFIPMWVNSATYIRELDVDFGPSGIFIFPFILGFLSTYFWKKFFDTGNIVYIVFYSFTTTLIVFSIFYIGTRLTFWLFGFLFTLIVTYFLKKGKKTSQNT
jgi:oligosaccharide repeat unit polymerase